ncbi:MAG: SPOR domain-containing protein [Bacteroidetes bacterium]|nr:SPOR domain-containing protein [Bacteroidota bacterium]
MMRKFTFSFVFIFFLHIILFGQSPETQTDDSPLPKPTISLGVGLFSFYGDLYEKHFQNPLTSRIGYELMLTQPINKAFTINLYTNIGKLSANERLTDRNLNFTSDIRLGGIGVMYNFNHFLKKDRAFSPYIFTGFESFEFLSKADLKDRNGNTYYYWSDGSIRNVDEASTTNTAGTVILQRDYDFETDIREQNADGFGKYPERSFAVPVGVGFLMHLSKKVNLRVGSTMHFTFTDYIDGISDKSVGSRQGNKQKDKFLFSTASLSYNLDFLPSSDLDTLPANHFDGVDFMAIWNEDTDADGVLDINDSCANTPLNVPVDAKGCPFDDDNDGVYNYADKELKTPPGSFVNMDGVQLTDSMLLLARNIYLDSTGLFASMEYEKHGSMIPGFTGIPKREYTVLLGAYKSGIKPELMTKFLSIKDVITTNLADSSTAYTVGKYKNFTEAMIRKEKVPQDSMMNPKVVYFMNGKYIEETAASYEAYQKELAAGASSSYAGSSQNQAGSSNGGIPTANINTNEPVFRVQLGAYRKQLSANVFPGITDLVEIKTEDGLYKYMAGAYSTFAEAAARKIEIVTQGYKGAFITAYKGGSRVSLVSQGATPANPKKVVKEDLSEPGPAVNTFNKGLVVFKVQVGIYKGEPPSDMQAKYKTIGNVKREITTTGLSRYVTGSYNDYKSALKLKEEMAKKGFGDAFVVSFYNDQYITIQEALELIK